MTVISYFVVEAKTMSVNEQRKDDVGLQRTRPPHTFQTEYENTPANRVREYTSKQSTRIHQQTEYENTVPANHAKLLQSLMKTIH